MNERQEKILRIAKLRHELLPLLTEHLTEAEDVVGYILKCHLFTEVILDDLIKLVLVENGEAVLSIGITYHQKLNLVSKLYLVDGIELLPEYVIISLRKLNQLRNKISHEIGKNVSDDDIQELFMGLENELPYPNILEYGQKAAIKRYAAFIFGCMLPKLELDNDEA
jgi:hypothetical protein